MIKQTPKMPTGKLKPSPKPDQIFIFLTTLLIEAFFLVIVIVEIHHQLHQEWLQLHLFTVQKNVAI